MSVSSPQYLFIIGSPRSGTTMLQILLGQHPQVATTVELTLYQYVEPWLQRWELELSNMQQTGRKRGLPALWSEAEAYEFLREFLARAYTKVTERFPGRTHILDKNPVYSLHVPLMKKLLPGARFIHIIRDGRDVACSLLAASEEMGFGVRTLGEGGRYWKRYLLGAREGRHLAAEDYLELRYEDFLGQQAELYGRVLEFCGLPADPAWIAQTLEDNTFAKMKSRRATGDREVLSSTVHYRQGQAGTWSAQFSARDRYEFDHLAGDLLGELGYAQPGWWTTKVSERILFPLQREGRRRARILGLALSLVRRAISGSRLPTGFEFFDR